MTALFRILVWLLAGAALLTAAALFLAYYLVGRSLPDYRADFTAPGAQGEIEVIRDANAVPHIYAQNDADAYFALGLVHAQERLWQMELTRRGAQGRLAELFGPAALPIDRRMRTFDLYTISRGALSRQTPETVAALEAYASGVNAWIRTVNDKALGRGAPEFFLFGDGLAPWTPVDSLAILKVMAMRLTDAAEKEVRRAKLLRLLPPARLADILPDYPDGGVMALPAFAAAYPGLRPPAPRRRADAGPLEETFLPRAGLSGASNAWAVRGSRSTTGAPLLATDPHLWLSAPGLWMLAHLEFPDKGVIGATIPGVPAVVIGRNRSFGWGLTATGMDDQDIYIEKVNPDDPDEYLTPGGWAKFRTRKVKIRVKGAPAEELTLRWTRHGPVIPPALFDVGAVTPAGHVATLSWTALTEDDQSIEALLRLGRVNSVEEGVEAAARQLAPAVNIVMADRNGVGVVTAGRAPKRRIASRTRGRIPALGWIAANDWDGLAPPWTTPRAIRPRSGVVANANNRVTNAPFPDNISFDWAAPYRIRRIEQRLNGRRFHTRESFIDLQNDAVSGMARAVLPLAARDLWWTRDEGVGDPRGDRRETALKMLGEWNGEMDRHAAEPLIFAAWMRALTLRIAADELGVLIDEVAGPRPLFLERVLRNVDGAGVWCDVNKTPRAETCAEMAKLALDDALDEITRAYGDDIAAWRWGEAHFARQEHTPLGRRWPFSLFVNIDQETSGGDYALLRGKSPGKGPTPDRNEHAAGFRAVYEFADLDRSVFITSTGQSGHFLSRHYDDFAARWSDGQYIPMTMNRGDIEAGALGIMRLTPGG